MLLLSLLLIVVNCCYIATHGLSGHCRPVGSVAGKQAGCPTSHSLNSLKRRGCCSNARQGRAVYDEQRALYSIKEIDREGALCVLCVEARGREPSPSLPPPPLAAKQSSL